MRTMTVRKNPAVWRVLLLACLVWVGVAEAAQTGSKPAYGTAVSPSAAVTTTVPVSAPGAVAPSAPVAPTLPLPTFTPQRRAEMASMAALLQIPTEILEKGALGFELVYLRRYGEARALFKDLELRYPTAAAGPYGQILVAQAIMSENLDFSLESAYLRAHKETLARSTAAIARKESLAWNYFLRGGARGMSSIYLFRKDKLVGCVEDGYGSLSDLQASRKLQPAFVDPVLGLGIYDYWRSWLTRQYKFLPFFPDRRAQGLQEIMLARDKGMFTPTLARLALVFTYMQAGEGAKAKAVALELRSQYPNNIINLQLLGQMAQRKKQVAEARGYYQEVLRVDPRNAQVRYYLGNLEYNQRNLAAAKGHFSAFVAADTDSEHEVRARVRLGDIYWLQGDSSNAMKQWRAAAAQDPGNKMAQRRVAGGFRPPPRKTGTTAGSRRPPTPGPVKSTIRVESSKGSAGAVEGPSRTEARDAGTPDGTLPSVAGERTPAPTGMTGEAAPTPVSSPLP